MTPELYILALAEWLPLAAFIVFLLSGTILLLLSHRQIGRRNRMLTARLAGLQGEREAPPTPLTPLPEMTTRRVHTHNVSSREVSENSPRLWVRGTVAGGILGVAIFIIEQVINGVVQGLNKILWRSQPPGKRQRVDNANGVSILMKKRSGVQSRPGTLF